MEIINTNHCGRCKREDIPFIKHAHAYRNGKKYQYYYCRDCNTECAKKYRSTKKGGKNIREAVYRSMKKHREKQNARAQIQYALKTGKITKPKICSSCHEEKEIHGHHEDYSKPLDVTWLCRSCHSDRHREIKKINQRRD